MSSALLADESISPGRFDVVVRRTANVTPRVMTVQLTPTAGPFPTWTAGAHIDICTPSGWRSYSLCGGLTDSNWLIAVQREENGRGGSAWLHDHLRAGMSLSARGPRNHFPLVDAVRYRFIAGGIGITPLLPMISTVASRDADWALTYGGRNIDSMAFLGELEQHGDRVRAWPEDSHGLLPLDTLLPVDDAVPTTVYCCGPAGLIEAVEHRCRLSTTIDLHTERFQPAKPIGNAADSGFDIVLASSGQRLRVGPGETILSALEEAGVLMAWSCRQGMCGTCELRILDGRPDHRDEVLTEEERNLNDRIITCVSRADSPLLTLDV